MKPTIYAHLAFRSSAEKDARRSELSRLSRTRALLATALVSSLVCWAGAAPAQQVSYRTDVRPIMDEHCVSCHACFDAPDQLDLRNRMGVERGASKTDPYAPRTTFVPMTFVSQTPQTVEQWRDLGFYSVIDGGKQSVMARMLKLGHDHPLQANAKLPSELDGRLDSLDRKNVAPNAIEFDAYAIQHPHEGMPFAVSGLDDKEYTTLMTWLDQGAKFDDVKIQPSAVEQEKISEWETFLNAPDDRSKLVARYIFEHYAGPQGFFYFDSGTQHVFALVRSTTPPGQEVVPVDPNKARRVSSPVEGPFYYRWMIVDQTPCVKQHDNLFDATGDRLERIKKIFYEQDWTVGKLPGYSLAEQDDPLNTFAAIPAKSRYKFLLQNPRFHMTMFTASVSCRSTLVADAVQDRMWVFFEDPDRSLYVNDAAYRASLAPYTAIADGTNDDFLAALQNLQTFQKQRGQAIVTAVSALEKSGKYHSQIADIWPNEVDTVMRYEDNVWTEKGAIGGFPKTSLIFDFPIFERTIYQGSIVPDIFAPIGVNLVVRNGFGAIARRDGELNLLRFLPPATRDALYASWYPLAPDDKLRVGRTGNPSDVPIPSEIAFKTDDPYREFLSLLLTRVGANADPIGRPASGDQPDPVTVAFRSIVAAGDQQPPLKFKNLLPSASFIRIDAPGKDPIIYTMKRDRDRYDLGDLNVTLKESDSGKDRVTIWGGVVAAYPNFMFRLDEKDVPAFAKMLIDVDTPEKFTAIVERWGVRRSSPEFWDDIQSVTDFVKRTEPLRAAAFDLNRYKNY